MRIPRLQTIVDSRLSTGFFFRDETPPKSSLFFGGSSRSGRGSSSFAWGLGVFELTGSSSLIYTKYANPMETLAAVALIYFVISYAMSQVAVRLERRLATSSH